MFGRSGVGLAFRIHPVMDLALEYSADPELMILILKMRFF
jgi:hypothetical protein